LTYLEPLTATGVAYFLFGERFTVWSGLGAMTILAAGLYVIVEPKAAVLSTPNPSNH
jgi:drug/metabolite transporter (DMT)-like permease